eukprot:GFYU01001225.1.p1 GENE.GFYU01001225.1~~GFYU01001225.1.p1  ORF type:complete len:629 (+),score=138.60 GFYU01001225.1:88-1974(+)
MTRLLLFAAVALLVFASVPVSNAQLPQLKCTNILFSGKGLNDLGDYTSCKAAPNGEYCLMTAALIINGTATPAMQFGVCGYNTCTPDQIAGEYSMVLGGLMGTLMNVPVQVYVVSNQCGDHESELEPAGQFTISLLAVFAALILGAFAVEYRQRVSLGSDLSAPLLGSTDDASAGGESMWSKIVKCWSFDDNWNALVAPARGAFTAMNGIRFFSISWVIFSHSLVLQMPPGFKNYSDITPPNGAYSGFLWQIIPGGFFAVDTFFFLSGFLASYLLMKTLNRSVDGLRNVEWVMVYVHRYLRITPNVGVLILLLTYLQPPLVSGPFAFYMNQSVQNCKDDGWWRTLLFIGNLYDSAGTCVGWAWYLFNDMQFFFLTPPLVYLYWKNKKLGLGVVGFLLIANWIATVIIVDHYDIAPAIFGGHFDFDKYYDKPWIRISPYLVGIFTAFAAHYLEAIQADMVAVDDDLRASRPSPFQAVPSWIMSIVYVFTGFLLASPIFGTYSNAGSIEGDWSKFENTFYLSFARSGWALGVSLLCLLCAFDRGFFVGRFLSAPFFTPLARLSFWAYLIHPLLMSVINCNKTQLYYYSAWNLSMWYCGYLLISFALALVLHLLVEKPLSNLESLAFRLRR